MPKTFGPLLSLLSLGLWGLPAWSQEVVERVAVTHPKFSVAGRFEVAASATFAVFTKFTEHGGFDGAVAYNILEQLAVELRGGYTFSRQTRLATDVARSIHSRDPNLSLRITDDFSNLWEMRAHGLLGVRYTPIYGKLSLFSEVPVHYQAYLWAGAGVGMFQRTSPVVCFAIASRTDGTCSDPLVEDRGRFLASFALGWRFFIGNHGALKLEFRNYLVPDIYRVDVDRVETEAGRPSGRLIPQGVTPLYFLEAGYVFLF